MDNIKFEDLLEKLINENDDDVEVCRMVEECKEEEEKINRCVFWLHQKLLIVSNISLKIMRPYVRV